MPCWGITKSDSESNPFDADPTPKRGFAVDSAFSWSLNEYIDQGNYERRSVALNKEVSALALLAKRRGISRHGISVRNGYAKELSLHLWLDPEKRHYVKLYVPYSGIATPKP